ncbi:MAG: DUF72 domain-containing protein [Pseudomonadota bacterium]|nr:DUF72 domain-containing protein [Pseudomonadota bacterium]
MTSNPITRIGTSGWHYAHWRGAFYPQALSSQGWLAYYAQRLSTVELNSSFYRLPSANAIEGWLAQVGSEFQFAVKASRYITHMKRLKDPQQTLPPFLERLALFDGFLGPILFQLPRGLAPDVPRLRRFLSALGRDYRYAFEFRDERWWTNEIFDLLADYQAGFCLFELAGQQPPKAVTTDLVYVRLHGPGDAYQGCYSPGRLRQWAERLQKWRTEGHATYCFFDNDEQGFAVQNALELQRLLIDSGAG